MKVTKKEYGVIASIEITLHDLSLIMRMCENSLAFVTQTHREEKEAILKNLYTVCDQLKDFEYNGEVK